MNQQELRDEFAKLINLKSIDYSKNVIDRYLDFFMKVIWAHHPNPVDTQRLADAKIIFQMLFSKLLSLRNALDGISFKAKDDSFLRPIIDPTTFAPIVRTIYESVCAFEIIYSIPNTEEKKDIVYNLWVKAGLEYRQRFASERTNPELLKKIKDEQQKIQACKNFIENTLTYTNLCKKGKDEMQNIMRKKDFRVLFIEDSVKKLGWQEISYQFGGKHINDVFTNIYTYFSLYAHPSHVSVFQFQDLFTKDKPYEEIILLNIKFSLTLLSMFLSDYIKLFPEIKTDFFLKEDLLTQISLDAYNKLVRGSDFLIDDTWVQTLE